MKNSSRILIEKHKGNVPKSLDELIKLPGIGRKTANVVLAPATQLYVIGQNPIPKLITISKIV
ncbi:MAG: hypothetical protein JRE64_04740 [Deltaproteobacteria bacterium]|nr:hypothetical protein [Deltaproteobacteria bacterium]